VYTIDHTFVVQTPHLVNWECPARGRALFDFYYVYYIRVYITPMPGICVLE
jgi:hypothetical protein